MTTPKLSSVLPLTEMNLRAALPPARKPIGLCSVCRAIGGSEDYESYSVITLDEVLKPKHASWARKPGAELHAFGDGTWRIAVEPTKNRPQVPAMPARS